MPVDEPLPPVPQADRQLLALHALRQRQLRTAFLHGRGRTWRDRRPLWPAVLAAAVIIALLIAGTSVVAAFRKQQELDTQPAAAAAAQIRPTDQLCQAEHCVQRIRWSSAPWDATGRRGSTTAFGSHGGPLIR